MAVRSRHFSGNERIRKASENRPVMRRGESGDGVVLLQEALLLDGYPMPISTAASGSPDGIFGRETESVVRTFQRDESLVSDGLAGRNTIGRLDEHMLAQEQHADPPLVAANWKMSTARTIHS